MENRPNLAILVSAKRMKLSLTELNTMSAQDFHDFIQLWTGDNDDEEGTRPATQDDIRNILG